MYERVKKDNLDILLSDISFEYTKTPKKNRILKDLNIPDNKIITGKEYINIFLKNNFHGYAWNKLIKKELFIKNNIRQNENIFLMEDVEMMLRLAYYSTRIGKINKSFYHYMWHGTNGSNASDTTKRLTDVENCFNSLLDFFKNDKDINITPIKERKIIEIAGQLKNYQNLRNTNEYKRLAKELLKENKKFPFFDFKYKFTPIIILLNILKVFPNENIMKFLFSLDYFAKIIR